MFPFITLPRELRNKIYTLAAPPPTAYSPQPALHPIPRTDSQLRCEYLEEHHCSCLLSLDFHLRSEQETTATWLSVFGEDAMQHARESRLLFDTRNYKTIIVRVKVDVDPDTAIVVPRYIPVENMLAREGRVAVCIRALGLFSIRVAWRKAMFWYEAVAERLAWELHLHLTNRPQSGARLALKGLRKLVTVLDFYAGVRTGGMEKEIWRRGVDTVFGQFWRMVEG